MVATIGGFGDGGGGAAPASDELLALLVGGLGEGGGGAARALPLLPDPLLLGGGGLGDGGGGRLIAAPPCRDVRSIIMGAPRIACEAHREGRGGERRSDVMEAVRVKAWAPARGRSGA